MMVDPLSSVSANLKLSTMAYTKTNMNIRISYFGAQIEFGGVKKQRGRARPHGMGLQIDDPLQHLLPNMHPNR